MEFTIDRSKWRCGGDHSKQIGEGNTRLLNEEGYMCCLGQCALQVGIPKDDIFNWGEPLEILNIIEENPFVILIEGAFTTRQLNTELSKRAMAINDDVELNQTEREAGLQRIFQEYGHTINFIN